MKINKLGLKNFCNHERSILELDKVNIIQGPNNNGKTPIFDAISWVLTGHGRNMKDSSDRAGELDLIRINSDRAEVNLTFDVDGKANQRLIRSRTKSNLSIKLQSLDKKDNIKQENIFDLLGTDEKKISAALDGMRNFLELDSKQRKQLIFDLMGKEINEPLIEQYLSKSEYQIDQPFITKVAEVVVKEGFESAMKRAIEKRKEFKRKLNELNLTEPANQKVFYHDKEYALSEIKSDELNKNVADLIKEKEQLIKRSGVLEENQQNNTTKLIQRKFALNAKIQDAQAKYAELNAQVKDEKKIGILTASVEDHEKQIKKLSEKIIGLKSQVDLIENQVKELNNLGDQCPKCHQDLTAEIKKKIVADLKKQLKTKQTEREKEIEAEKKLRDSLKAVSEQLKKLKTDHQALEAAKFEIDKIEAEMNALTKQIETGSKRKIDDAEIGNIETELTGVKQELAELEDLQKQVDKFQVDLKEYEASLENKKLYDVWIATYDKLAKLLAPDGIIDDILQSIISDFQARIDQSNSILGDKVMIDKSDFSFKIGLKTEGMLDKKGSEFQRLAWIISEAIAHFSGLRMWLCDRVDILDKSNKQQLLKLIQRVSDDYDTIILLGTKDQKSEMSNGNGMKFFWVKDGMVS